MVTEIYWATSGSSLLLIPFFTVLIVLLLFNFNFLKNAAEKLTHKKHRSKLLKNYSVTRQRIRSFIFAAALISLATAMFRPQWDKKEEAVSHEGRDVLISLDISRSMLAEDFSPNRLEFTKLKIQSLLKLLHADRVGLTVFAGSSFLQCPFTSDFSAFKMFLGQVDAQTVSSASTAIDKALSNAIEIFERTADRKHKILVIITDGEDFSLNIDPIVERAKESGITLIAMGIGTTQGAPVPKLSFGGEKVGHETNPDGSIALTKLNEELLKKMANKLDGLYQKITYDDRDIEKVASTIEKFEKEKIEDRSISKYQDQYPWFTAISFILLALEWLL
jgi:Ca-activated chloride channel homolog